MTPCSTCARPLTASRVEHERMMKREPVCAWCARRAEVENVPPMPAADAMEMAK